MLLASPLTERSSPGSPQTRTSSPSTKPAAPACFIRVLVRVTARAGLAEQTALVLIRPTRRPLQTDEEWRADQDSLIGDGQQQTDDGHLGMLGGAYADRFTGDTRFVFDPIQGWPSPGFSLGFGRIVYSNNYDGNYRYMLIDPNGTRHDLGLASALGSNTLQTTDGSHITYAGNAVNGGTLNYNDGTKVT